MQALLIEMPFKCVTQPSIGLSLLKAAVTARGHQCSILYANANFAAYIGAELYETIMERFPPEFLIGDLIFAPAVRGETPDVRPIQRELALRSSRRQKALCDIPSWFWRSLPQLQVLAEEFVEDLADQLIETDSSIYGLNATFQTMPALALAKALKARQPNRWIILGGAHCEGEMGLAIHRNYPWIDFVCRGEGEQLLPHLMDQLEQSISAFEQIPGLVWRTDGATQWQSDSAPRLANLDELPYPEYWDWIQQLEDLGLGENRHALWLPVETSRGCWWGEKQHCIFCGLNGESLRFREKSSTRVLSELNQLRKYGINKLFGVDLIFPYRYFTTLLPQMISEDFGYKIFFEIKANLSREQLSLLRNAGVYSLQPGIESLSSPILKLMRKGISAYQNVRLLKWSAEYGIDVEWSLLYGFPGESSEDYSGCAELISKLVHLRPPSSGCARLRIDRFSPLHFDYKSFDMKEPRPALPYQIIYGLSDKELMSLAYHFDCDSTGDFPYMAPILQAMDRWHSSVGEASFTSLSVDNCLYLFDRRASPTCSIAVLDGVRRDIFLACDAGETTETIVSRVGISRDEANCFLREFDENGWTAEIDSRHLSLAVSMPNEIAMAAPESLWSSICHAIYRARILHTWNPLIRSLRVPPSSEPTISSTATL